MSCVCAQAQTWRLLAAYSASFAVMQRMFQHLPKPEQESPNSVGSRDSYLGTIISSLLFVLGTVDCCFKWIQMVCLIEFLVPNTLQEGSWELYTWNPYDLCFDRKRQCFDSTAGVTRQVLGICSGNKVPMRSDSDQVFPTFRPSVCINHFSPLAAPWTKARHLGMF